MYLPCFSSQIRYSWLKIIGKWCFLLLWVFHDSIQLSFAWIWTCHLKREHARKPWRCPPQDRVCFGLRSPESFHSNSRQYTFLPSFFPHLQITSSRRDLLFAFLISLPLNFCTAHDMAKNKPSNPHKRLTIAQKKEILLLLEQKVSKICPALILWGSGRYNQV